MVLPIYARAGTTLARATGMSAVLCDDDTMIVPKLPADDVRPARRPTTQFASTPAQPMTWPWLLAGLLLIAALAKPISAGGELQRSAQAQELLRVLPGQ